MAGWAEGDPLEVAPRLLGAVLTHGGVSVRLTEVEAYAGPADPGSHAYRGPTERNAVMFGPPGYAYVYRSYGIHWCLNFVCEPEGSASAVLIRAIEPTQGFAKMYRRRRGIDDDRLLCSGPGRLAQALGVTRLHNGLALDRLPFELYARQSVPEIVAGVVTSSSNAPTAVSSVVSGFVATVKETFSVLGAPVSGVWITSNS